WQIPICIKSGNAAQQCRVMAQKEQTLTYDGCAQNTYANAGGVGYYRTSYDDAAVKGFADNAETALTPGERISFIGDQWALVNNGNQNAATFLSMLQGFRTENSRAVMETLLGP